MYMCAHIHCVTREGDCIGLLHYNNHSTHTAVYISEICTFDDVTILFHNFKNGHIRNIAARSTFPEMYVRNPDLLNSCLSERPLFKLQVDT